MMRLNESGIAVAQNMNGKQRQKLATEIKQKPHWPAGLMDENEQRKEVRSNRYSVYITLFIISRVMVVGALN